MAMQASRSESEMLSKVVDDLTRKGYEVVREPGFHDLPDFLRGYRPDLIAHRGDEHLVVEIKRRRRAIQASHWRALAEEIARHSGWQFQLVLAEVPGVSEIAMPPPPSLEEVRKQLASTRRLYQTGQHAAALLLLWSLLEAATYHRLSELDESPNRPKTPIALLKDLVSFGFMRQGEYDKLAPVVELRNATAHGHSNMRLARTTFDKLFRLVERLASSQLEPTPAK